MNQPASSAQHHALSSIIEKLALRLFTLFLLVFSFLLFYFGPLIAPAYKDVFVSFSTSLFASLVFAQLYSFIVERHHQRAVNTELERSVKIAIEEMKQAEQTHIEQIMDHTVAKIEEVEKSHYHQISQRFHELIPTDSFPPTDKPDKAFNELLAHELKQSRSYWFKGGTGRYIASRLMFARRHNLNCHVLLTDPTRKDLLHLYASDRFGIALSSAEMEKRVTQVQQEIYMTIVDLHDIAHLTGSIDLRMYRGPVFYRTEIMDDFLLISYFTAQPTAYPTTYLYGKESFYYKMYLTDFYQTFELAEHSLLLQAKTTEQELANFLQKLGCDSAIMPHLRQEAQAFREDFFSQLGWHIDP
jgi:hypothetical protein